MYLIDADIEWPLTSTRGSFVRGPIPSSYPYPPINPTNENAHQDQEARIRKLEQIVEQLERKIENLKHGLNRNA